MVYKDELERIGRELNERKADLITELKTLPDGQLLCTDQGGYRRYMQRIPAKGNRKKEHRYGIKKKPEVLNGLIRKEYVTDALKIIDQNIRAVELACKRYHPIDEDTVMRQFLEDYPELVSGIYHGIVDPEEWVKRYPRMDNYHPENLIHRTYDGIGSRSKNELYIASRLDHYGIIYRWDCPTGIPGLRRNPDYTTLRRRDWKIIYWEHFGMMDVPSYKADYEQKMKDYEKVGIVPWDNLIMTFDTVKGGMRADIIEAMIKCWLL
ncbi:MAG: hypothetical protein IKD59_07815 [Lachnospiraceae bacterium]|nr:hypothetical protein [Lachnospiraceae bacterium]